MPLQDIIGQRILNVYCDSISKANTYEWRTVHGKNKTFQRRYKVSTGKDEPEKNPPPLGTRNTAHSAGLSDRLTHGINYNGIFYDNKGERIHLTKDQLEEAKKHYSQKSIKLNSHTDKEKKQVDAGMKQKKDEVLAHIERKDPLYLEELGKHKENHDKQQRDEELRKRRVSLALQHIQSTHDASGILSDLKVIRGDIKHEIDPTFTITTVDKNGKDVEVKRQLDDLIPSFEKLASTPGTKVKIKKIALEHFDEYSIKDFEHRNIVVDPKLHQKIYDKVNKKLTKDGA